MLLVALLLAAQAREIPGTKEVGDAWSGYAVRGDGWWLVGSELGFIDVGADTLRSDAKPATGVRGQWYWIEGRVRRVVRHRSTKRGAIYDFDVAEARPARWPENWKDFPEEIGKTRPFAGQLSVGQEYRAVVSWDGAHDRWMVEALEQPEWMHGRTLTLDGPNCGDAVNVRSEASFLIEAGHYEMVALVGIPAIPEGGVLYTGRFTSPISCDGSNGVDR